MTYRIAILGDFSGRAARGLVETGDALAGARAIKFDIDALEEVIEGFGTEIVLPIGEGGVAVPLPDLDALHPDELYANVEMFQELAGLRRQLKSGRADQVAERLAAMGAAVPVPPPPPSQASVVPVGTLSDFEGLIGGRAAAVEASPADEIIRRVMGPHVVAAPDPGVPAMIAAVDAALSSAMSLVLHHPELRAIEASWRELEFLARRIETGEDVSLTLYDISAAEIAADLAAAPSPEESGLARLLRDARPGEAGYDLLAGLYTFEKIPPHAELLARLGRLAGGLGTPFLAAIDPDGLAEGEVAADAAWASLRALPEADWLALATPEVMLRRPYGRRTDPIDRFAYEEFDRKAGLKGLLWGNPVVVLVTLLAADGGRGGAHVAEDMPYHVTEDRHGDQVQLPCTSRAMTSAAVAAVEAAGVIPIVSTKGRDEVRVGAYQTLSGRALPAPSTPNRPTPPPSGAVQFAAGLSRVELDEMRAARRARAVGTGGDEVDPDLARLLEGL